MVEESPRLRGQKRADYAALAGRKVLVSPAPLASQSGAAGHPSPRLAHLPLLRLAGAPDTTATAAAPSQQQAVVAVAGSDAPVAALGESIPLRDVQSLCLAVLDARLSERLRELSRRAGASRDEHRRQAQRTEARIARHLKRKRARETELPRTSLAPTETGSVDTEVALASHGGTVDSVSEVDAAPARSRRRLGERWRADAPASIADGGESTVGLDRLSEEALPLDAMVMEFRDDERDAQRSIEDALIRRAVEIRKRNFELVRERLPKQPEAPRGKTHHDYFLEEMVWLATDFREEAKWKTAARKRLLRALDKYHEENALRREREVERLEQQRRRVARVLARSVRKFWEHIERLYARHREDVDARLQKLQMERQLQQLVQRTEQYTEVIAKRVAGAVDSAAGSMTRGADEKREVTEPQPPTVKPEDVDAADRSATLSLSSSSSSSSSSETPEMDAAGEDASRASSSESMSAEAPDATAADEVDGVEAGTARVFEQLLQEYSLKSRAAVPADNHERDERSGSALDTSSVVANGAAAAPPDTQHRLEASLDDSLLTRVLLTREPPLFRGTLRDYQLDGVNWMAALHEKRLNGILADEMGLGKTVQTIALFAWLASEMREWGPHLCVVPTSVVLNWETEFKKFFPGCKVLSYFGSVKERRERRRGWTKPEAFHVCITSYNVVLQDARIFRRKRWNYLVLDEAQNIKNFESQRWQTLLTFHAKRRLLLTGTPLQNSLMELWSLLHFLMPSVFHSHTEFKQWFHAPMQQFVEGAAALADELVSRLHRVLRPFILRRVKRDVERALPPKSEEVVLCRLSKRQRELYDDFMTRASTREKLESGNYLSVMNVLMQLRKVCNHPDLFAGRPIAQPFSSAEAITLRVPRRAREVDVGGRSARLRFIDESAAEADWQRMAALSAAALLLGESERQQQMATRVGDGDRTARHKWWEECQAVEAEDAWQLRRRSCSAPVPHAVYGADCVARLTLRDDHVEERPTLPHLFTTVEEVAERAVDEALPFALCAVRARAPVPVLQSAAEFRYRRERHVPRALHYLLSLWRPLGAYSEVVFPDARLLQWDCGKLQEMAVLLRRLQAGGHRALIFTQMSRMLNILEQFFSLHRIAYLRMDGFTKTDMRLRLCERFNSDPRYFALISTTRSGGVGLNLTGADTVIFYDSDWNPTIDAQAQDRCHRIGQTRPVRVYRLVSEYTVEENILRKARQKRQLESVVISAGSFTTETLQRLHPLELLDASFRPSMETDADGRLRVGLLQAEQERVEMEVWRSGGGGSDDEDDEDEVAARAAEAAERQREAWEFADDDDDDDNDNGHEEKEKRQDAVVRKAERVSPLQRLAMQLYVQHRGEWSIAEQPRADGDDAASQLTYRVDRRPYRSVQKNEPGGLAIYRPPAEAPGDLVFDRETGSEDALFFPHAYARLARCGMPTRRQRERLTALSGAARRRGGPVVTDVAGQGSASSSRENSESTRAVMQNRVQDGAISAVPEKRARLASMRPSASTSLPLPPSSSSSSSPLSAENGAAAPPGAHPRPIWSDEEDRLLWALAKRLGMNAALIADALAIHPLYRLGHCPPRTPSQMEERLATLRTGAGRRWGGWASMPTSPTSPTTTFPHTVVPSMAIGAGESPNAARTQLHWAALQSAVNQSLTGRARSAEHGRSHRVTPPTASSAAPNGLAVPVAHASHERVAQTTLPQVARASPRELASTLPVSSRHRAGVKLEEDMRRRRPFIRNPGANAMLRRMQAQAVVAARTSRPSAFDASSAPTGHSSHRNSAGDSTSSTHPPSSTGGGDATTGPLERPGRRPTPAPPDARRRAP